MSMEVVSDSILYTTKKLSGLNSLFDDDFDTDIITFVNGVFATLTQIGFGPSTGFSITGYTECWADIGETDPVALSLVKPYIYLKTRMQFDPPTIGAVKEAFQKQIDEYESRISYQVDPRRNNGFHD